MIRYDKPLEVGYLCSEKPIFILTAIHVRMQFTSHFGSKNFGRFQYPLLWGCQSPMDPATGRRVGCGQARVATREKGWSIEGWGRRWGGRVRGRNFCGSLGCFCFFPSFHDGLTWFNHPVVFEGAIWSSQSDGEPRELLRVSKAHDT